MILVILFVASWVQKLADRGPFLFSPKVVKFFFPAPLLHPAGHDAAWDLLYSSAPLAILAGQGPGGGIVRESRTNAPGSCLSSSVQLGPMSSCWECTTRYHFPLAMASQLPPLGMINAGAASLEPTCQGAAAFAVGHAAKKIPVSSPCPFHRCTALLGTTEPALYGVNLR